MGWYPGDSVRMDSKTQGGAARGGSSMHSYTVNSQMAADSDSAMSHGTRITGDWIAIRNYSQRRWTRTWRRLTAREERWLDSDTIRGGSTWFDVTHLTATDSDLATSPDTKRGTGWPTRLKEVVGWWVKPVAYPCLTVTSTVRLM